MKLSFLFSLLLHFQPFCCWSYFSVYFTVFTVFRLLTDFVCLYNYEFWLSLCKIVQSSVILLLPLFTVTSLWPFCCLWGDTHSISLCYMRNIVQLNWFCTIFESKHFLIYIINTITNWWISLSKICHSWPNNIATHSCTEHICEILCYLVICDIFLIMKLVS